MTEADDRHSVTMAVANVAGTLLGVVGVAALVGWHAAVWGGGGVQAAARDFFGQPLVWIPAVLAGIVAHEFAHGLCWAVLSGNTFAVIRFGVQWQMLTPFAHCTVPIPARAYWIGAATPGLVTGVLPAVVGTLSGWGWLAAFGWFLTLAAGGDALVLLLLRGVGAREMVEDHPSRAGCVVRRDPTA